ncbi:hypothetical protein A9P82_08155 [Arachidicoccus ginsenosidimutans]|uniref:hypothetical protein n=1 Tax=Arachidicoccus sp. BS20 TaxID=1850526 RepID=UPI0007F108B2|nr:hypothetical protein [Arachidicoccus sp. BS20]ANI89265.1 hypothetical protein A9P82_08155 [Arachidicoccus sp. BS20]
MNTIKKIILSTALLTVYSFIYGQSTQKSDKEVIAFVNYAKANIFKIDVSPIYQFNRIKNESIFTFPEYEHNWHGVFSRKELDYIFKQMKDTTNKSVYIAQNHPSQSDSLGFLFYKLFDLKAQIEHYGDKDSIDIYSLKQISADCSVCSTDTVRRSLVNRFTNEYNQSINSIRIFIKKSINEYSYKYSKPIFVRNFKYCVFIFSHEGRGHIQVYKKANGIWSLYKTIVDFSTNEGLY